MKFENIYKEMMILCMRFNFIKIIRTSQVVFSLKNIELNNFY